MKHKAFTLIELLVVISIIALLIAILLPALTKARQLAKSLDCLSRERQLGLVHQIHLDEHDGYLIAPTVRGNLWSWYFAKEYPRPLNIPTAGTGSASDSLLVCPEDTSPYNHPTLTYPFLKIELGGSYAMNFDNYARGPSGGWTAMGAARGGAPWDAANDEHWRAERSDVVKSPSNHVLFWDTNGPRTHEHRTTTQYRFSRTDYLTRLPDPQRHGGTGNLLFMDGHASSVRPDAIESRWVTWDHSVYP